MSQPTSLLYNWYKYYLSVRNYKTIVIALSKGSKIKAKHSGKKVIILKEASNKKQYIHLTKEDMDKNLLFYLRDEINLPIASSCNGEGICKKCIFNKNKLLCRFKVKEIKEEISISYL